MPGVRELVNVCESTAVGAAADILPKIRRLLLFAAIENYLPTKEKHVTRELWAAVSVICGALFSVICCYLREI